MTGALEIINRFYPVDNDLKRLLLLHSRQVCDKALALAAACPQLPLDLELVRQGAMLHDIGIYQCHAPSIFCNGTENYIAHGVIGGRLLRQLDPALEPCARICERHTGTGLSADEIRQQKLPLPEQDFFPQTLEEKLICLADKFYSKSSPNKEKSLPSIRHSLSKFGEDTLQRLDELCALFKLQR